MKREQGNSVGGSVDCLPEPKGRDAAGPRLSPATRFWSTPGTSGETLCPGLCFLSKCPFSSSLHTGCLCSPDQGQKPSPANSSLFRLSLSLCSRLLESSVPDSTSPREEHRWSSLIPRLSVRPRERGRASWFRKNVPFYGVGR